MKQQFEIVIRHISKSYKKQSVLRDISFQVSSGECIGILGGNGSGKSTLLSILGGIQNADSGELLLRRRLPAGEENLFRNRKKRAAIVGYVPQEPPLLEELSARDNLLLWYDKQSIQQELEDGVLAMLGIDAFLKVPVSKMSGGMKKRLAISCATAGSPQLLLLDEPSAALDLICKERIANYLKDYKSRGGAVILATHDIQELELCDRLFILKNGMLEPYVFDGNVHRLVGML